MRTGAPEQREVYEMTDLPPPTFTDTLREIARTVDDWDLPEPMVISNHGGGLVLVTVPSAGFDQWAARFPEGRMTDQQVESIRYHRCRGTLVNGTRLTVHAFEDIEHTEAVPA